MRTPVQLAPAPSRKPRKPSLLEFVEQVLKLSISATQRTLIKSMAGQLLSDAELAIFKLCTGRDAYVPRYYRQVTAVCGARGGKDSRIAAPRALYEALFGGHEKKLGVGEKGLVVLVAQDAEAAGIAFGYVEGYLKANPALNKQVATYLTRAIVLKNGITVKCFPSTAASIRGYTVVAAILDEVAYFRVEGAVNSDEDIEVAVLRGMGTLGGPLLKISTPSGQAGILYRDVKRAWGKDDPDLLVFKATTEMMNPSFPALEEMARNMTPARFAQEFLAEFASDIESFLSMADIEKCIDWNVSERAPDLTRHKYFAFVDMAGGGADHHVLAIGHNESSPDLLGTGGSSKRHVLDFLWGASSATSELGSVAPMMVEHLRRYNVGHVTGDRYTGSEGGWVADAFRKAGGINYETPEWTPANGERAVYADSPTIYGQVAPLFRTGEARILDTSLPLVRELSLLQRTPGTQKDRIAHVRGGHDDYACAVAGLMHILAGKGRSGPPIGHSLGVPRGGGPTAIGGTGGSRGLGSVGGPAAQLGGMYSNPGTRWQ
jgi:hypothetical protein